MDRSYSKICPSDVTVEGEIVRFFEDFFKISDTPDVHEEYSRKFADDATFILASNLSKGRDEILQTRKGMWSAVASRSHTVGKIFPFGNKSNEVMLYGQVAYDLKDGGHAEKDWAARAELTQKGGNGPWQLQYYQVYLDTASPASTK